MLLAGSAVRKDIRLVDPRAQGLNGHFLGFYNKYDAPTLHTSTSSVLRLKIHPHHCTDLVQLIKELATRIILFWGMGRHEAVRLVVKTVDRSHPFGLRPTPQLSITSKWITQIQVCSFYQLSSLLNFLFEQKLLA